MTVTSADNMIEFLNDSFDDRTSSVDLANSLYSYSSSKFGISNGQVYPLSATPNIAQAVLVNVNSKDYSTELTLPTIAGMLGVHIRWQDMNNFIVDKEVVLWI